MQAMLLFGEETWVLLAAMTKELEGYHMGFFRQATGKTESLQWDRTWSRAEAVTVLKQAGTNKLGTYIYRQQKQCIIGWRWDPSMRFMIGRQAKG